MFTVFFVAGGPDFGDTIPRHRLLIYFITLQGERQPHFTQQQGNSI